MVAAALATACGDRVAGILLGSRCATLACQDRAALEEAADAGAKERDKNDRATFEDVDEVAKKVAELDERLGAQLAAILTKLDALASR